MYEISAGIFVIPITVYGSMTHQPRLLAFAAFSMSVGSFIMALPHFATGLHELGDPTAETCSQLNNNGNIIFVCNLIFSTPRSILKFFLIPISWHYSYLLKSVSKFLHWFLLLVNWRTSIIQFAINVTYELVSLMMNDNDYSVYLSRTIVHNLILA